MRKDIVNEAFSIHLFVLRILGFMPFKNHEKLFRVQSIIVYITMTTLMPILSIIWFLTEDSLDLQKISENGYTAIEAIIFIFKYLPCVLYGPQMTKTIYSLNEPIFTNIKVRQEEYIDDGIRVCKTTSAVFFICVFVALFAYSVVPAVFYPGTMPIEIWRPTNSSLGYVIAYGYVVTASYHSGMVCIFYDMLAACLIYQITCQVKILRDNLQHLNEDVEEQLKDIQSDVKVLAQLKNELIYNQIKINIIHHQHILSFIDKYEDHFSFSIFVQLLASCIVICFSIFAITLVEPFSSLFIFMLNYTINMLIQIAVYCVFGATLYEESINISTSIYMGNWLEFDLKSKKALIFLMERANKPMNMTAGTVFDLSLATLTMVLKRAYSMYAVLERYQ